MVISIRLRSRVLFHEASAKNLRTIFDNRHWQDLSELETELDRVCSHPHSKLAPSDLFPGFQCIAYDSKLGLVFLT